MKNCAYIVALVLCLAVSKIQAQTAVLENAVKRINTYESLSYKLADAQRGPFSDEETKLTIQTWVKRDLQSGVELFKMDEARGFIIIGNGSTRVDLDLNEKTYRINTDSQNEPYNSPYHWAKFMHDKLASVPGKIKRLKDTAINAANCYHIRITMNDTVNARQFYDLCLNKTTYLPVYVKEYLQGAFGKGDVKATVLATMINEYRYADYQIDPKNFPDIENYKIPADFKTEHKVPLMATGSPSPDWVLQDLKGVKYSGAKLQGKLLLVDFYFNSCGACALSQPVLKRLHQKYKSSDITFLSINTSDTKEAVAKYVAKNGIRYPVLISGKEVAKKFQVSAFPTFYLIDSKGIVAGVIEGYGDDFEKDLTARIDKQLKR